MVSVMSLSEMTLHAPIDQTEARSICEQVISELGWVVVSEDDTRLVTGEDATRLHCHSQPADAEIELTTADEQTVIAIEVSVPGWGIISAKHAREQADLLARRIGLAIIHRSRPGESGG